MAGKPLSGKTLSSSSSSSSGDARFLHDIQTLSKALSLPSPSSTSTRRSLPPPPPPPSNPSSKPSSIWRSLKSLSHLRHRRSFDCTFSLHVKAIHSLPSSLEGSSLSVHFHPSSSTSNPPLSTKPAKACRGSAQFDETLTYRSTICTKSSSSSRGKYDSRQFVIRVTCAGTDLGRHTVDLTRLLPLTVAELEAEAESEMEEEEEEEEEERQKGKWSTSFRLMGRAHGAKLNVSFGYTLIGVRENRENKEKRIGDGLNNSKHNNRLVPSFVKGRNISSSRSVEEVKMLHDLLPFMKPVVSGLQTEKETEKECVLNTELDVGKKEIMVEEEESSPEPKYCTSVEPTNQFQLDSHPVDKKADDFTVTEQGTEVEIETETKSEGLIEKKQLVPEESSEESVLEELESIFENLSCLESNDQSMNVEEENNELHRAALPQDDDDDDTDYNLDDVTESVASEFLTMLGLDLEHSPFGLGSDNSGGGDDLDSPRERLLRQFEKESLGGFFGMEYDEEDLISENENENDPGIEDFENGAEIEEDDFGFDFDFTSLIQEVEAEMPISKAKLLEDAETEALMREFGLDDHSFHNNNNNNNNNNSLPCNTCHSQPEGSPINLPPLADDVGPFVQTKGGGFLRSMNPHLFNNSKSGSGGSLVMQASSPIVVPAEMGGGVMDILQKLAEVGIEKLSKQASKLMPLEDVTGKTMQQLAWDCDRSSMLESSSSYVSKDTTNLINKKKGNNISNPSPYTKNEISSSSEYVSLENLAPLAMEKIEALSIEGLRIQSNMSDKYAPSNITPQSIGEISALEGKISQNALSLGLEGTGGLQLLDLKSTDGDQEEEEDVVDDDNGLMGLSLTLDEWMRFDSGLIEGEEGEITDRTAKILAAHHANNANLVHEKKGRNNKRRAWGLLGNNFTVGIMVQLRDPLRDFEPVGAPMLALIQVERVFVPPKLKVYGNVAFKVDIEIDEERETVVEENTIKGEEIEAAAIIPQYKINEVHVAGFQTEPEPIPDKNKNKNKNKNNPWSNNMQQQSGSRWLIAAGMGKANNKHPLLSSKTGNNNNNNISGAKLGKGDTLWSISSSQVNGSKRNPNIWLSDKTGRRK